MDLKSVIFILILLLTFPAVSASDVNETIFVDDIIEYHTLILESDIIQSDINPDYESNISENEMAYDDILISNESGDNDPIEYYEDYLTEYCEHISYTEYSNESIDNQEYIDSIFVVEIPTTFNLNLLKDVELEIHNFMSSYQFKFYDSINLNLLILDVNVCFDKVISKYLTKDVITCSKKIKGNYIYSIDNIIVDGSFNSSILSFFNSFMRNNHSNNIYIIGSFFTLKW